MTSLGMVDPFPSSCEKRNGATDDSRSYCGDAADSDRLLGMLAATAVIWECETSVGWDVECIEMQDSVPQTASQDCLTVEAVACLAWGQTASSLCTRTPLHVCLLIADEEEDFTLFSSHCTSKAKSIMPPIVFKKLLLLPQYGQHLIKKKGKQLALADFLRRIMRIMGPQ
jgi:hypothetical protein